MALDSRHTILEKTSVLGLVIRSNDYAIYSFPYDAAIITVPFNGTNTMERALKRAKLLYDVAKENGWR